MCTGNGRAGLWTETEEKTGSGSIGLNDVIRSRIINTSFNILKNVIEELAPSTFSFSMQLYETIDISQSNQLLLLVRCVHANAIEEEFLFCESLLETTRAVDFFEWQKFPLPKKNFDWNEKLHNLCTDRVPEMLGNTSGFATLAKKEASHVVVTHLLLDRHALATKTLPTTLKEVLSRAMKVINFTEAGL
jgi:hypothetical protein